MKKGIICISIIVAIILVFGIVLSNRYKCNILEYKVISDKEAYITYEVQNNTNEKVTLRVYSSIEKSGEVVAQKLTYIIVKAKSSSKMTVVLTTKRDVSFYGSKAKIRVEESTL